MIKPRDNKINILNEIKTGSVNKRLVVINSNGLLHYFYLINGRIHYFYVEDTSDKSKVNVGDIYIGVVSHVNKEIDGCFINIDQNETVFLPGSEMVNPILVNRSYDGKLHESDVILVQIKKLGFSNKKPLVSTKYKISSEVDLVQLSRTCVKYSLIYKGQSIVDYIDKYHGGFDNTLVVCSDEYAVNYMNELIDKDRYADISIKLYDDEHISISSLYSLKSKLDEISNVKVWLKSGGYLFVNPTEAMTVIDVNTGKSGGKNKDKAIIDVNVEAINEIAYQILARNLSGIIIVDLINSKQADFNTILTKAMEDAFEAIKPAPKLVDITKLGLAEITRRKIHPDIYDSLRKMDRTILM